MHETWQCPECKRTFSRKNQRHACGTGDRSVVLRNRSEAVVQLYASIERFIESLGSIEVVARDRYVLFRSVRIFADLVILTDGVRVAVHLDRRSDHPIFRKVASDRRSVTHVTTLRTEDDVEIIKPFLMEAYTLSLADRDG